MICLELSRDVLKMRELDEGLVGVKVGMFLQHMVLFLFIGCALQEHNVRMLCGRMLLANDRDYQKKIKIKILF